MMEMIEKKKKKQRSTDWTERMARPTAADVEVDGQNAKCRSQRP